MKSVDLYLLLLLILSLQSCKAQENNHHTSTTPNLNNQPEDRLQDFDSYFKENTGVNNAPNGISRNILQDKDGVIWFATFEGIFSYDGKNFVNHTNADGLRRHRGFSLLEDSKGNIWFGTIGAGVYVYNKEAAFVGRNPWRNISTDDGLVNDDVGSLFEDSKGNIWMGTQEGLSCFNGEVFKNYTAEDGLVDEDINGIIEDTDGKIWFAARGEACHFDGNRFTKITTASGKSFNNVRSIIKDSKGNIWLGGNDGLWRYDGSKFKDYKTRFIGNIYEDSKGSIWVSQSDPEKTTSMALYQYVAHDLFSENPEPIKIVGGNGQVFGIIEDRDGNIWFGHEKGVCRYDGMTFNYFNK